MTTITRDKLARVYTWRGSYPDPGRFHVDRCPGKADRCPGKEKGRASALHASMIIALVALACGEATPACSRAALGFANSEWSCRKDSLRSRFEAMVSSTPASSRPVLDPEGVDR